MTSVSAWQTVEIARFSNQWEEQVFERRDRDLPEVRRVPTATDRVVIEGIEGIHVSRECWRDRWKGKVGKEALKVIGDWLTKHRTAMTETHKTSEEGIVQDLVVGPTKTQGAST